MILEHAPCVAASSSHDFILAAQAPVIVSIMFEIITDLFRLHERCLAYAACFSTDTSRLFVVSAAAHRGLLHGIRIEYEW
jgi:hypothetical protein